MDANFFSTLSIEDMIYYKYKYDLVFMQNKK